MKSSSGCWIPSACNSIPNRSSWALKTPNSPQTTQRHRGKPKALTTKVTKDHEESSRAQTLALIHFLRGTSCPLWGNPDFLCVSVSSVVDDFLTSTCARSKILRNIFSLSLPVLVFWLDG